MRLEANMVIDISTIKSKAMQMLLMKSSKSEIIHMIAINLVKIYYFKSIDTAAKINPMYVFLDGIYVDEGRRIIKEQVEKILNSNAKTNIINEIINKVERLTYVDRNLLHNEGNIDLLCVKNGILNIKTETLINFNPEIILLSKIPVTYNKEKPCLLFLKYLEETLSSKDIILVQEWFGFMLRKIYHEKKALICIGPTDTGKTVLLNLITNFLGIDNICAVDLHDIVRDTHATHDFYNKYANINDELTSNDLSNVSNFKKLTGRSKFRINPKFKDAFKFENFAKMIFATNKMPSLKESIEDPESYYNRWMIIDFDNVVEDNEQNKHLIDELSLEDSMSGVLNWALIGYKRLMENGRFSYDLAWQETERKLKKSGESVFSFEVECCNKCEGNLVGKDEMFNRYLEYCKLNNKTPEISKESFGKRFKPSYVINKNNGPEEYRGWLHIKVKEILPIMGF